MEINQKINKVSWYFIENRIKQSENILRININYFKYKISKEIEGYWQGSYVVYLIDELNYTSCPYKFS